ncbi:hypothetical protein M621_11025 [Serratia plymuthica S13]|uniref:Uncharacterized protein n=1 Tax=Serratia plymuthica S13 TaxID=1348660 RepID=S4YNZ5_SERPL|nr:hypothetical protein M621_11025 [Serratia plymuthica S13]
MDKKTNKTSGQATGMEFESRLVVQNTVKDR